MFTKSNPLYKRWCASKESDVVLSHKLEVKPPVVILPEPIVEEPKVEEIKVKVEEPKVEEVKVEVEEPKVEEIKVEVEEPKVEEVKVEEVKVEVEEVEEVKVEVEEPIVEEPEPIVEEPIVEEPIVEEPIVEEPKEKISIKIEEIPSDQEYTGEITGIVEEYNESYSEKLKGDSEESPFKDKESESGSSIKETISEEEEREKEEREYEEQERIRLEERQHHYAEQLKSAINSNSMNLFYIKEELVPMPRIRPVDNKGHNDVLGSKKNKWGH